MAQIRYFKCDWCGAQANEEKMPEAWKPGLIHDPVTMEQVEGHFCSAEHKSLYMKHEPSAIVAAKEGYKKEFYSHFRKVKAQK